MPTASGSVAPRDAVRGNLIAVITMAFLTGMFFAMGLQKIVQHDLFYLAIIPLLALLIFAGALSVRRILKAVP